MSDKFYERKCAGCGHTWIGPSSQSDCPQCGRLAKSIGDEITKKVVSDNDFKKALR